jgi:hypothetical protein
MSFGGTAVRSTFGGTASRSALPCHRRVEPHRGFHRSCGTTHRPDVIGGTALRSALPYYRRVKREAVPPIGFYPTWKGACRAR